MCRSFLIGTWEILKTTVNVPLAVGLGKLINNPGIHVFRKSDKFIVAVKRRTMKSFVESKN
jgi:hypothetical protein